MVVVPLNHALVLTGLVTAFAGCRQAPKPRVVVQTETTAATAAKADSQLVCEGLEAYPMPRTYRQILADAPRGSRKNTTVLEAKLAIDPAGNISHLRFVRLSTADSINQYAIENLRRQHYKPAIFEGNPVAVCSTVTINVDLSR